MGWFWLSREAILTKSKITSHNASILPHKRCKQRILWSVMMVARALDKWKWVCVWIRNPLPYHGPLLLALVESYRRVEGGDLGHTASILEAFSFIPVLQECSSYSLTLSFPLFSSPWIHSLSTFLTYLLWLCCALFLFSFMFTIHPTLLYHIIWWFEICGPSGRMQHSFRASILLDFPQQPSRGWCMTESQ